MLRCPLLKMEEGYANDIIENSNYLKQPAHKTNTKKTHVFHDVFLLYFTRKERDEETGYGYFGARYMDHELTTMWLSVDPMADKYPGISPYAYCAWNPVKLVDSDGEFPAPIHAVMVFKACMKTGVSGILRIGPKNILRMCVGASVIADGFHWKRPQVHLDGYNNQNAELTSAYNNAISDYQNAFSDGDYFRAGEALHTIADFYAHSNYIESYDEYSRDKALSAIVFSYFLLSRDVTAGCGGRRGLFPETVSMPHHLRYNRERNRRRTPVRR